MSDDAFFRSFEGEDRRAKVRAAQRAAARAMADVEVGDLVWYHPVFGRPERKACVVQTRPRPLGEDVVVNLLVDDTEQGRVVAAALWALTRRTP